MKIEKHGRIDLNDDCGDAVKILITGDLCPLVEVEANLLAGNSEIVFGDVLPELLDKDISITNLELALTTGGKPIDKCGPNLRANPDIMPELAKTGLDVYSVANNHARDWGDESFMETLSHITKAGAKHVGGGRNAAAAADPLRIEIKGLKLAIFSICMHCDCDAGVNTPGVNALNTPYNAMDIMKMSREGYKVVVLFHDGKEHVPFPSRRIRNYARAFIDAGASAVIGHHPHIVRGLEIYKGGLIAYSLGNFLFPQRSEANMPAPFWFRGYSLRLKINKKGLCGFDLIPHKYNKEKSRMELMNGAELDVFLKGLNALNEILADDDENERYFSADCDRYIHYGNHIKDFGENLLNKSWKSKDAKINAKVFNHYLTCNEHWDLLENVSFRKWHGITDTPEDLEKIISCLGR